MTEDLKNEKCVNKDCACNENCSSNEECSCNENDCKDKKNNKHNVNEKLKKQLQDILLENQNLKNEALLAKADLVNYRKRKDEEVVKMLKYSNEDLIKELLPVIDNFERAIKLDTPDLTDELSKFLEGFKMMYCNQVAILEKYGVKAIDGNNKPFDPNYHQAVITEHRDGIDSGMVLEVLQKGYLLKDKVIRHAMVKVSE